MHVLSCARVYACAGAYTVMCVCVCVCVCMCFHSCREERYKLLMGLKFTVERLLAVQASNVWSAYGGFKRISADLEAILCHRIKVTQVSVLWLS